MKNLIKFPATCAVVATVLLLGACGEDAADGGQVSSSTQGPVTVSAATSSVATNWAERPEQNPTDLTAQQFCAILTQQDIAPLAEGDVGDRPTPTDDNGLPGCTWPLSEGYGSLAMAVTKPFDVDILLDNTVSGKYAMRDGTMYRQTKEDIARCRAMVQTPKTPEGFLLSVSVDGSVGAAVNPCKAAIPQTEKVLKALGW